MIEELSQLRLTSTVKKHRDDFHLSSEKVSLADFAIACESLKEFHRMNPESLAHHDNEKPKAAKLKFLKEVYQVMLGTGGRLAQHL